MVTSWFLLWGVNGWFGKRVYGARQDLSLKTSGGHPSES